MTGRQAGFSFLCSLPDLCTHATDPTDRDCLSLIKLADSQIDAYIFDNRYRHHDPRYLGQAKHQAKPGPLLGHYRRKGEEIMFTTSWARLMKTMRTFVVLTLVSAVVALTASPALAWEATRFRNWRTGELTDNWGIKCNDGTVISFTGANGPDFNFKGCAKHGGLTVSPDPLPGSIQEFPISALDVLIIDLPFTPASVGSLVFGEIVSPDDALKLTGLGDPASWSSIFVTIGSGFDPAIDFPGVSVFGLSEDIVVTAVPEPSSIALLIIGLTALRRLHTTAR